MGLLGAARKRREPRAAAGARSSPSSSPRGSRARASGARSCSWACRPPHARPSGSRSRAGSGGALVLSGAIAGLAALAPVLGYKGYFESGLGAGAGFGGIAVALLGRGHPVGLVLAALLFGTLEQGGLVINARVPMEIMTVLQGVVIVAVALADARVADRARFEGSHDELRRAPFSARRCSRRRCAWRSRTRARGWAACGASAAAS